MGIVLYEMLTGRVPFDGDRPVTVAMKQINEPPVPPRVFAQDIPPELDAVVMKALSKRPEDRFGDWDAFAHALSELVAKQLIPLARFTEVKDSERFSLLRKL